MQRAYYFNNQNTLLSDYNIGKVGKSVNIDTEENGTTAKKFFVVAARFTILRKKIKVMGN